MKGKKIVLVFTLLFFAAVVSCGGGKQVKDGDTKGPSNRGQATGYGTIYDNDTALARDRAIDDARNKLVKKILGATVEGRSVVQDYALVESIVESKSIGLVKDEEIIKEGADQGAFIVTIEGTVYPTAIEETIEKLIKDYGRPKFMVLIKETFEGKTNMPGFTVTELTMMELMGDKGFEFVDAAMTQQLLNRERRKMSSAMSGKVGEDVQQMLLDDLGAECLIIGTAVTSDQSGALSAYSKNMKSKQAILNLKAIDVYSGRILASTSANAPGVHIDSATASKMAIQRCLQKILGKYDEDEGKFTQGPFMKQITKQFLKAATGRMILMTIQGLDFAGLTKFRNQLEHRVRGVKKIYSRGQSGTASKIEVEFAGKTTDLAEELNAKAANLGFEVSIKETFPNRMLLTVKMIK